MEQNRAFRGAPEAVADLAGPHGLRRLETVAGADHFDGGVREALGDVLEAWLRSAVR